jgi:hypothetical protein
MVQESHPEWDRTDKWLANLKFQLSHKEDRA